MACQWWNIRERRFRLANRRISCIVQFGDGEVVDVERKNELA